MADSLVVCHPSRQLLDWFFYVQSSRERDLDYLNWLSDFVSEHKDDTIPLKSPAGARWTVGDLEDTMYFGQQDELNAWGKFYLPEVVNMQVIGVVEGTSCPYDQLVLMTCRDKKLYAFDGEELHMVALNLEKLIKEGMNYPSSKSYYRGEAFQKTDWNKVRTGKVAKRLDQEHHKLVTEKKSKFLENLKATRPRQEHADAAIWKY